MGPRGTPRKSIFLVSKMAFSGFPVSGLCRGSGGLQDLFHLPWLPGPLHDRCFLELKYVSATMRPHPNYTHTHMFIIWELTSRLHRTPVTYGFLAGIGLCISGASTRYFCERQLRTRILWQLSSNDTHICSTKDLFPDDLCNRFGPHSTC